MNTGHGERKKRFKPGDLVWLPGAMLPRYSSEIGTIVSSDFCEISEGEIEIEIVKVYLAIGKTVSIDCAYVEKIE